MVIKQASYLIHITDVDRTELQPILPMNIKTIAAQQAKRFGHKLGPWSESMEFEVSKCPHCQMQIKIMKVFFGPEYTSYHIFIDTKRVYGIRVAGENIVKSNHYNKNSANNSIICKRISSLI